MILTDIWWGTPGGYTNLTFKADSFYLGKKLIEKKFVQDNQFLFLVVYY